MTFEEFEKLIQKLLSERLKKEGFEINVEHQKKFFSNTGNTYKIDLSYSFNIFGIKYLTLVECKLWNKYVTRDRIGYFKSIIDDLKAHKGIVFTSKGFQSGALEYAKSQNIGLIKVLNNKFEIESNFIGEIDELTSSLLSQDTFKPTNPFVTLGLFHPNEDIFDFISKYYGKELADFLKYPVNEIGQIAKSQLKSMPQNWIEVYTLIETAGLNYKLSNENELRMLNMALIMLNNR